jgi:hypothetical protein
MNSKIEKILWSIAIPGFGQFLNGKFLKGFLFIALEFLINVNSHLNNAIILSFQGDILGSLKTTNFQWLMFYPCVYMFAIWDAYRDAGGGQTHLSYLPFVLPAYLGTVGIIYSSKFRIMGHLLGVVWLPIVLALTGVAIGCILQKCLHPRL